MGKILDRKWGGTEDTEKKMNLTQLVGGEKGPMSDSTQASRFWLSRKASGHPSLSPVLCEVKSKDSECHPSLYPTFRSCPPSMGCRQDAP